MEIFFFFWYALFKFSIIGHSNLDFFLVLSGELNFENGKSNFEYGELNFKNGKLNLENDLLECF